VKGVFEGFGDWNCLSFGVNELRASLKNKIWGTLGEGVEFSFLF